MKFEIINDITVYIRHYFMSYVVFINALYAFIKTQNIKPSKRHIVTACAINLLVSLMYSFFAAIEMIALSQMILYVGVILSLSILIENNKNKALIIGFITTSYAHVLKFVSFYVVSVIVYFLFGPVQSIWPYFMNCIVSVMMNYIIMKVKRLKNGIQFFEKTENLGLGIVASGMIFLFAIIGFGEYPDLLFLILMSLGIIICGFGLFLWIKKSITKQYREKQQLKSELEYKKRLEQKEAKIEQLNRSNDFLSKVVHRDNHLMSSLSTAIDTYKKTKSDDNKEKLLDEIKTLINERGELIQTELKESKLFSSTGNSLIDSAINDLYIQAAAHGMDFNLSVSKTVDEIIGKYISQTDLQTLICDHINDAIIAIDAKNENNGKILVELSMENDNYTITIFDSGVDFEIDTLAKLGKERVTTHADNGGSGIGFMTTFETLRKSYASLIITEYENKTPFSKSVSIRFDGNTTFIIQSYRKEEIQSNLNRDDVILL